ncbi:MAG TPA: DUF4282 domain-containing protein [Planctomycetota bacterium]|nr:DUF4282 domain-containing protein [Planctomycetota bacterium]
MSIEMSCPGCGKQLRLPDSMAGKRGKCPSCGTVMDVPAVEVAQEVPEPAGLPPQQYYQPPPVSYGSGGSGSSDFGDFVAFRKMITPVIIQVVFWIAVAVVVIVSLIGLGESRGDAKLAAVLTLLLGPIAVRMYCELLIVIFRIHSNLEQIEKNTRR